MLELFFEAPFALAQLRLGASGPYIDGFAQKLNDEGYSAWSATRLIRSAVHFGHFVQQRSHSVESIDEGTLSDFHQHEPCTCLYFRGGTSEHGYRGAKLFLDYLRDRGIAQTTETAPAPLIEPFQQWLRHRLGLKESTQYRYGRRVSALIEALGDDPGRYSAQLIRGFVLSYSRRCGRAGTASLCTAVRAFLGFLVAQGGYPAGLEHSLPALPGWREASPPQHLTPDEVERVLGSCDENAAIGLRNRAILLLLARLGLRAADVAALQLDDIDWSDGSFIVSGKTSRAVRLPLPQEVGDAILKYLPRRPSARTDVVFVRHKAPLGPLTSTSVSFIAGEALRRAGVQTSSYGAHILRHTAATQMLRQGIPLSQIGLVLRHRSQDMTAHYARVDFDLLNHVVQPWPEVPSC